MEVLSTPIEGLLVIQQKVFRDERGYFLEAYNQNSFSAAGIDADFVQDNISVSAKGVLRGLHFQNPPHAQGKLVRVLRGAALDVAVDIRKNSESYGRHFSIKLSEDNQKMLWIPPGFAHGFLSLEENTLFFYKCTGFYNKESEQSLLWNDPELNISWPIDSPLVSQKDQEAKKFSEFKSLF